MAGVRRKETKDPVLHRFSIALTTGEREKLSEIQHRLTEGDPQHIYRSRNALIRDMILHTHKGLTE